MKKIIVAASLIILNLLNGGQLFAMTEVEEHKIIPYEQIVQEVKEEAEQTFIKDMMKNILLNYRILVSSLETIMASTSSTEKTELNKKIFGTIKSIETDLLQFRLQAKTKHFEKAQKLSANVTKDFAPISILFALARSQHNLTPEMILQGFKLVRKTLEEFSFKVKELKAIQESLIQISDQMINNLETTSAENED